MKGKEEGAPAVDVPALEVVMVAPDVLMLEATPLDCASTPVGGVGVIEDGKDAVADERVDAAVVGPPEPNGENLKQV